MAKVDIVGLKESYFAGEKISGEVVLSGVSGWRIRGIELTLYYTVISLSRGRYQYRAMDKVTISSLRLEGERIFSSDSSSYSFNINIPDNAPPSVDLDDFSIKWFLMVKADVPLRRDLIKNIEVTVLNSSVPSEFEFNEVIEENDFFKVILYKRAFKVGEDIKGKIFLKSIPNRFRKLVICFEIYVSYVFPMRTGSVKREHIFRGSCIEFSRNELVDKSEVEFTLSNSESIPTFAFQNLVLNPMLNVKMDIAFAPDIKLKIPVKIYYEKHVPRAISGIPMSEEILVVSRSTLRSEVLNLMKDGKVRDLVDINLETGYKYNIKEIKAICEELVREGLLEAVEEGELLKKYRIKKIIV